MAGNKSPGIVFEFKPNEPAESIVILRGKAERDALLAQGYKRLELPYGFNCNVMVMYSDGTAPDTAECTAEATDEHYTTLELKAFWRTYMRKTKRPSRDDIQIIADMAQCSKSDAKELLRIFAEGI